MHPFLTYSMPDTSEERKENSSTIHSPMIFLSPAFGSFLHAICIALVLVDICVRRYPNKQYHSNCNISHDKDREAAENSDEDKSYLNCNKYSSGDMGDNRKSSNFIKTIRNMSLLLEFSVVFVCFAMMRLGTFRYNPSLEEFIASITLSKDSISQRQSPHRDPSALRGTSSLPTSRTTFHHAETDEVIYEVPRYQNRSSISC